MASMRNWGLFNVGRITIAGLWLHQDLGTLAARSNRQEAAELGHYKIANVDVSAIPEHRRRPSPLGDPARAQLRNGAGCESSGWPAVRRILDRVRS